MWSWCSANIVITHHSRLLHEMEACRTEKSLHLKLILPSACGLHLKKFWKDMFYIYNNNLFNIQKSHITSLTCKLSSKLKFLAFLLVLTIELKLIRHRTYNQIQRMMQTRKDRTCKHIK